MRAESNALSRHALVQAPSALSTVQLKQDALIGSFSEHASDPYSLAGIVGGGAAFRLVRGLSVAGLGGLVANSRLGAALLRAGSNIAGVAAESGTFVTSQRLLLLAAGEADVSVLKWSGRDGIKNAWLSSMVSFSAMRVSGVFTAGQNSFIQHTASVNAMVGANHLTAAAGFTEAHSGSLMEEYIEASVMDLQVRAGMGLLHHFAPGIGRWERGLDLVHQTRNASLGRPELREGFSFADAISLMGAEQGGPRQAEGPAAASETPSETARRSATLRPRLLALGALSSLLVGFTHTESLGLQAAGVGLGVALIGKEVCDRYIWPRLRQSFVDNARARGVDVSNINIEGQALAPLREIFRQARIDFAQNKKIVIPNSLTASAIIAALSACWAAIVHRPLIATLALGLAPFLDGIDGPVARRNKAASRTGELADDFADNACNGPILGTLTFAHLSYLGHPLLGLITASAFTLGIRTRLSEFRLFSDNPSLKPTHDPMGNPHYENGRGFLGVASPVAAMSALGLYNSVHNSPYFFFGGCMLTALSLVDMMARGKIGKGLSGARAAAYSLPFGALALYQNIVDTSHVGLGTRTIDVLSSATASFALFYMVDPYARALYRKMSKGSGEGRDSEPDIEPVTLGQGGTRDSGGSSAEGDGPSQHPQ